MKKRILFLLCVTALLISALVSCKSSSGNKGDGGEQSNIFYQKESSVGIIAANENVSAELLNSISSSLLYWDARPEILSLDKSKYEHEIVIGETETREVSKKAYLYLSRMESEEHYASYVIYSDGKSIGIAYDHESALEAAVEVLIEKYFVYEAIKFEVGVYEKETISILEYYGEKDKERLEEDWKALEKKIGPEYGPEIVAAFKEYYTNYNENVVLWFANLYDPDIGGFYFSNSARNTPGYLPDLESTSQALGFIENMGVYARDVIPYEMKQKMGEFAYNMQDPNGFFYHPQWTKEATDAHLSRRARDLGHAAGLLSLAGMTPKYPIATDQIEEVEGNTTPASSLTNRLGSSSVSAVSKVVSVEATVPHLANKEVFLNYLRGLDVYNNSYGPGNQISAQFSQIQAAGLADVCVDYFESIQNPKNGLWEDEVKYGSINGLLKISGMWASVKRVFPYAKEAIASTIECIMSDEPTGGVVAMYNCWYSILNINNSMAYATEGADFVKETRKTLFELAPDAIRLTAEKVMQCQKPDGSFSWSDKYSSSTSQGMPVAVPYSEEGDVNATVIGFSGAIGRCFDALGLARVRPFGQRELYLYLYTLEHLSPVVKQDTINIGDPYDFEGASVGSTPQDFNITLGTGSSATVADDPTGAKNKVLHLQSAPGNGDTVYIPNSVGMDGSCMVFTGDFYVSSKNSTGYFMQITMDKCYLFTLQTDSAGNICVIDANSSSDSNTIYTTYGEKLKFDEWFNVKVEYYVGNADTVRIKGYINDKLVCVSDNYWDQSGTKFKQDVEPGTNAVETRLYCMMSSTIDMYLDNLHTYKLNKSYTIEHPEDPYAPNVDAPDKAEKKFDFENFESDVVYSENQKVDYREQIVVYNGTYSYGNDLKATYSSAGVSASELNKSKSICIKTSGSNAKIQIPTTVRSSAANCGTLGFDVQVLDAAAGDFAVIKFYDKNNSANSTSAIMGITLSCVVEGDEKYVVMKEMPGGVAGAQLEGVKIPVGSIVNLRFEFFHDEDATLVFVNKVSSAASFAICTGGHKFTLGYASIETLGNVASTIQIDNVNSERIVRSYATATAPEGNRKDYKFDNTDGIETLGNVKVEKDGNNNVLKIGADGTVIIPVDHRGPVVNVTTLEMLMKLSSANSDTKLYIRLVDENMEDIFAVALTGNNAGMIMRELTKYGETENILTTLATKSDYVLKFEVCPSSETVNLVVNGVATSITNVFFDDDKLDRKISYLVIESEGVHLSIDNTYVEAVNTVFVQCKPTVGENKENAATTYTFESSSSISLPKKLEKELKSSGAAIRIKSLFRDGVLSNALKFTTTNGGNDTLRFNTMSTVSSANCAVFETDMLLSGFGKDCSIAQFNIGEAFMFHISTTKDTGEIKIQALTAGSSAGRVFGKAATLGNEGEWIHLRIEVFAGDMNSALAKVYVNGELVIVTNNYKGYRNNTETPAAPSTDVSNARFYTYGAANGSIFFDNVSYNMCNVSRGNDAINDQRPDYVPPAS